MSSAAQDTTPGGSDGVRSPPRTRGISWSAAHSQGDSGVEHLGQPRLDDAAAAEIVDIDAERAGEDVQHLRRGVEPDLLAAVRAMNRQIAAAQVVARLVGHQRRSETGDED